MMRSFLMGYEARGDHAMRATEISRKCLGDALQLTHALRSRALLRAVGMQTNQWVGRPIRHRSQQASPGLAMSHGQG
jgi:hypothetical protein